MELSHIQNISCDTNEKLLALPELVLPEIIDFDEKTVKLAFEREFEIKLFEPNPFEDDFQLFQGIFKESLLASPIILTSHFWNEAGAIKVRRNNREIAAIVAIKDNKKYGNIHFHNHHKDIKEELNEFAHDAKRFLEKEGKRKLILDRLSGINFRGMADNALSTILRTNGNIEGIKYAFERIERHYANYDQKEMTITLLEEKEAKVLDQLGFAPMPIDNRTYSKSIRFEKNDDSNLRTTIRFPVTYKKHPQEFVLKVK